ncbi:hypothetical protein VDGE_07467 [Verticillium dahliae]|uniref:Carbonic anhydrase n=2 Tax=Verticillium dahliae TaxID=27337 RepID=A0A444RPY8_VERDA|nr:hypothetical protein VDGE_07467 [Verticillium dahliae]
MPKLLSQTSVIDSNTGRRLYNALLNCPGQLTINLSKTQDLDAYVASSNDIFPYMLSSFQPQAGCTREKPAGLQSQANSQLPSISSNISGLHPNDVLTHRNVGNIISPLDISTSAVIEFAVAHLVVKHVVICGHSECIGIQSAMALKRVGGTLDTWLAPLRAIRQQLSNELLCLQDDGAQEMLIAEKNIEYGVTALLANVTIQEHIASRNLQVHGYMLDAPSGRIRDLGLGPKSSTLTAIASPTHEIIRGNYAQLIFEEDGTATMTAK